MSKYLMAFIVIVLWFSFYSCGLKKAPNALEKPKVEEVEIQKAVADKWQQTWYETLAAAKKEGKLNIYGGMEPKVRDAWTGYFKEKYGIIVEHMAGGGSDVAQKLIEEHKAGIYYADQYIGGGTTIYTLLKPAGIIEKFEHQLFLPEVLDPKVRINGILPWMDEDHTMFSWSLAPSGPIIVNTKMVGPGTIKSYKDFLQPQWKGKIILFDPTTPGQGLQWFSIYGGEGILGLDYMKALVRQEPYITRDLRLQAEWVARGKYPISLGTGWSRFEPYASAGAPVAQNKVEEPDYLSAAMGHVSWIKNAPHPAASKLFTNWLLSKEGQALTQRVWERQTAREDVETEGVKLMGVREKGLKYINAEIESIYKKKEIYAEMAKEIFDPLLK